MTSIMIATRWGLSCTHQTRNLPDFFKFLLGPKWANWDSEKITFEARRIFVYPVGFAVCRCLFVGAGGVEGLILRASQVCLGKLYLLDIWNSLPFGRLLLGKQ